MTKRLAFAAVLISAAIALAPSVSQAQKKQRDKITRQEILESAQKDADIFQVIRALRPQYFNPPTTTRSMGGSNSRGAQLAVYVDGRRETGLDALRLIMANSVDEVRYLEPSKAETELGPSVQGGAIILKLYSPSAADSTKPPQ